MNVYNPERFNVFYKEYYKQSCLFVRSYVRDDLVAEDIVSDALIKLWQLAEKENLENPKAVLFILLKNKSLDYLRHQKVKEAALTNISDIAKRDLDIKISTLEATEPSYIFEKDIKNIIAKALSILPEQTRLIFEKSRFEHMSKPEIAKKYNITIKGVDYHLYKAISYLKEMLKDYLVN